MNKRDKNARSDLVTAAEALDRELRTFEGLAEAVRKHPLSSQKNLERMAATLKEVTESDDRLSAGIQALLAAINHARERQEAQARAVHARALELQQRAEELGALQQRYAALGVSAGELNALMQQIAARKSETGASDADLAAGLGGLIEKLGQIAGEAKHLTETARERDFVDVMQQADALRQQLQAARNKLAQFQKSLAPA